MKQCTYCGKEFPDEALICSIDGRPLPDVLSAPSAAEPASTIPDLLDGVGAPKKEIHFVWQFFGSLVGGVLLIGAAVASYQICNWIWAWGEKPWYEVPEWVHDFGWLIAFVLCIAGLIAGLAGMAAIIWPFGELCSRFEQRRKLLAQTSGILAILFAVPAFLIIGIPIAVIGIMVFATGVGVAVALWPLTIIVLLMLILAKK
jgi:hypothetical protein